MASGKAVKQVEVFEVVVKQPASVVWKAYVDEGPRAVVAAAPDFYERIDIVEGGKWATPGSVAHIKLRKALSHLPGVNFLKTKFEHLDHNKFEAKWSIVEGYGLGTHWLSFSHTIKIADGHEAGSSVIIHTLEFEKIGEHDLHEVYKKHAIEVTRALETFLNTNPNFTPVSN